MGIIKCGTMHDAKDQTNDQQINGTFREHHTSTQASYRSAKTLGKNDGSAKAKM
jgi:hypothetical protein